jgi:hypothetical protein
MKSIFRLFVCLLLVVGWGLAALSLHVVRTPDEVPTLVPKEKLDYRDTYVDTTKWTIDDVAKHPAVVTRLIRAGKADAIKHVVPDKNGDVPSQLGDALQRAERNKSTQPTTVGGAVHAVLGWF